METLIELIKNEPNWIIVALVSGIVGIVLSKLYDYIRYLIVTLSSQVSFYSSRNSTPSPKVTSAAKRTP